MLQFNKLRLSGFKSFVDSTELIIDLGLTGVVGPNGCGKSNLVEALRWVMGETSAKQMRGSGMEDVIFGGTTNRPPRNVAEVVLGLDNSERQAAAQFNDTEELDVSRRIERDKGSTYRVNGKEVRARDVQLLFADSATGARSTALVSQGRIGAVINAKPTERRGLLEEAAGITGLHSRRHEAELRLRGAETNLERLDDILITLDAQLSGLKKQSRQANRYRNLSDHIRQAEATMFYLRWIAAEKQLDENRLLVSTAEAAVTELTVVSGQASVKQAEAVEILPTLRQNEAEAAAELQRLVLARNGLDEEEERIAASLADLKRRIEQTASDSERELALSVDAQRAIERLTEEQRELEATREGEDGLREEAHNALQEINQTVSMLDGRVNQLTNELATAEARRASLSNRVSELSERHHRLTSRAIEITEQRKVLEADNPDVDILERAETILFDSRADLEAARAALETAEQSRSEAHDAVQLAVTAVHDVAADLTKLEAEENALARILETGDEDLWPPVLDAVTVSPGFEAALGAALGEDLSAPADEAAPVHWRTRSKPATGSGLPQGSIALSSQSSAPEVLAARLAQIGVVETDEEGARLAPSLAQGQRLVSKQGGLWRWDGFTVSSGAKTAAAIRLEQRNRLNDIRSQVTEARQKVETAEAKRDETRLLEDTAREAEHTHRQAVSEADHASNVARDALSEAKEKATAHSTRLASLADTDAAVSEDLEVTEVQLVEAKREHEEIADPVERREEVESLREQLGERRSEQLEYKSRHDSLERIATERRRRLDDIVIEITSWQNRSEGASQQIEQLAERKLTLGADLERLSTRPEEIEGQRNSLLEAIETSEAKRQHSADKLAESENWVRNTEQALKEAEIALSRSREDMIRTQGAVEQARLTCHSIAERIKDRLECRPDQLFEISGLKEDTPLPETEATERKVERLIRERDTMGPVNLRAEHEATELSEQIEALNIEREDLIKAIEKLRHGISELNREGRQRLLDSFKLVDSHFQELFQKLFGGGRAYLTLTESEDPLMAGLEIMASPPGKKLQILSLLSGGEQALTALALLFAVFLTNPAPICVLDEVDAPLDDANVDRFCTMLEEMTTKERTRFLVITHHRMTMARMDRLFGVTMSERGVSQLVSVDLHQAVKIRDSA